jgi:glycosyltransferase involved in cell wall biosynthesis
MKVVHIASGDTWGGAERVLALLAEGIREHANCSVEVLLFNEGRLANRLRDGGVKVDIIPESKLSFTRLACATRRWLDAQRPDVVHAHRYKEILVAAFANAPRKRGFVATVHGLEPSQQLTRARAVLIWGSLVAAKLAGAHVVAVSSELTRRLKRVLGHRRILRIPNPMPPVDDSKKPPDLRQRFGWPSSRPLVGFVGRLEKVKGPDIFVEVAARCHMDAGFILIGAGSLARELSAHVTAAGLTRRVGFLGEVPDAAAYIRQFDVLALPSRHEGLPLVLLEAAASEVPVVAFDVGGVNEVLHRNRPGAKLVAPADESAFCAAVEAFLRDPERSRLDAIQAAESIRVEFSVSTIASAYRDVYRLTARTQRPYPA